MGIHGAPKTLITAMLILKLPTPEWFARTTSLLREGQLPRTATSFLCFWLTVNFLG